MAGIPPILAGLAAALANEQQSKQAALYQMAKEGFVSEAEYRPASLGKRPILSDYLGNPDMVIRPEPMGLNAAPSRPPLAMPTTNEALPPVSAVPMPPKTYELPGLAPETFGGPGTNYFKDIRMTKEGAMPKKELSEYANGILAKVYDNPSLRNGIMKDKNLSNWEKAQILDETKPGKGGGTQPPQRFNNIGVKANQAFLEALGAIENKTLTRGQAIKAIMNNYSNQEISPAEKSFIAKELGTKTLQEILAEMMVLQGQQQKQ